MSVEWPIEGRQFRLRLANSFATLNGYRHDNGSVDFWLSSGGGDPDADQDLGNLLATEAHDLGQALQHLAGGHKPAHVHLVVMDTGGMFGAYLDSATAHSAAQATGSVVVELPVSADYRPPVKRAPRNE